MPNVRGLVNDPEFLKLQPADQRQALHSLTGDESFSSLSDADLGQFVGHFKGSSAPAGVLSPDVTKPTQLEQNSSTFGKYIPQAAVPALAAVDKYVSQPLNKFAAFSGEIQKARQQHSLAAELGHPVGTTPQSADASIAAAEQANPVQMGTAAAIGNLKGSLSADPRNYPLMAGSLAYAPARWGMQAAFGVMMGHQANEQAKQFGTVMDNPDVPKAQKVELGVDAGMSTIMSGMAGASMGKSSPKPEAQPTTLSGLQGKVLKGFEPKTGETLLPEGAQRIDYSVNQAFALKNRTDTAAQATADRILSDQLARGRNASGNPRVVVGNPESPQGDVGIPRTYTPQGVSEIPPMNNPPQGVSTNIPYTVRGVSDIPPMDNPPQGVSTNVPYRVSGEYNKPPVVSTTSTAREANTSGIKPPQKAPLPIADNAKAAFQAALKSKAKPGNGVDPLLEAAKTQSTPLPKLASDGRPMGEFKNLGSDDARNLAQNVVKLMSQGKTVSKQALSSLKEGTGVTTEGKSPEQLYHDIQNWRQASNFSVAKLNETKPVPPETPRAPAQPESQKPVQAAQTPGATETPTTSPAGIKLEALQRTIEFSKKVATKMGASIPEADHQKVFDALDAATKLGTPDPLIAATRLDNALRTYTRGLRKGSYDTAALSALDVAKARGESGFLGNRIRYTDSELAVQANLHVPRMLDQFEGMTDSQLARGQVGQKLEDPIFMKQVGLADRVTPGLRDRWEALNRRAWAASPGDIADPVGTLSRAMNGGVTVTASDLARDSLNSITGQLNRLRMQQTHQLEGEITRQNGYSIEDSNRFFQQMETGDYGSMNDADKTLAPTLRNLQDHWWEKVAAIKGIDPQNFIENYMPHLWANVGRARSYFNSVASSRAFNVKTGFLKPRFYDMYNEGIAAGLEPVTYNPIKAVLLRVGEMQKYVMVHDAMTQMEQRGTGQFVPYDKPAPDGWVPIKADVLRGFKQMEEGQPPVAGRWYAPEPAAKVFNNYLSPGLRGNRVYDTLATANNAINQANLSLSGFHAIEMAFQGITSDMAAGIQKGLRGDLKGGLTDTGRAFLFPAAVANTAWNGFKFGREFLEPGRYADMTRSVDLATKAGFYPERPAEYQYDAVSQLGKALKQFSANTGAGKIVPGAKILYRGMGTVFQGLAYPLMNKWVPLMKAGATFHLMEDILENNPNSSPDVISKLANEAVDSVDNRMGEVIYDRVNQSRIAKDLGQISFRSYGWNFGTARELGGGIADTPTQLMSLMKGNGFRVTPRMAYTMALPVAVGYLNAMLQVALIGKLPQEPLDYLYPHDIHGNRISVKNYLTDASQFVHHPVDTILHKASPLLSTSYALYENKDFFGNEIHNPDDPAWKQALEYAKFGVKTVLPFSVTNAMEMSQRGSGKMGVGAAAIGLTPAPRWVGQTEAEQVAYRKMISGMPSGARSEAQSARYNHKVQLLRQLQNKEITYKDVLDNVKQNNISPKDADSILNAAASNVSPLERYTQNLSPKDALDVWEKATPEERKKLLPQMAKKADSIMQNLPPDQAQELMQQYKNRVFPAK